jgi:acetyl-CoA synthetase (ADP-forming)
MPPPERKNLTEPEAKEFIRRYGITTPRGAVVSALEGAVEKANTLGYPIVLKVVSRDILHKSEVGGVESGLKNETALRQAWTEMLMNIADKAAEARVEGFLIEEMAPAGLETIVGGFRDEKFGGVVMFGVGGVWVEAIKDVSYALAPVSQAEALEMMKELKGWPILCGWRAEQYDIEAVKEAIVKISSVISETEIRELEINPLIVYKSGVMAVDARVAF